MSQIRIGDYGGEKRSATGRRNREPKDPTHRLRPLRMSRVRLWQRKIEVTEQPHDTISSVRFTKDRRIRRCGEVKRGENSANRSSRNSTFQPLCLMRICFCLDRAEALMLCCDDRPSQIWKRNLQRWPPPLFGPPIWP